MITRSTEALVLAAVLILSGCTGKFAVLQEIDNSAQLLGTVHDSRGAWNPFLKENDMILDADTDDYVRQVPLSVHGGRNADGIYAIRFSLGRHLSGVHKADQNDPEHRLVTGKEARTAGNILFAVPQDGVYTIRFSPQHRRYSITPSVRHLKHIDSMQINGFVHDTEGDEEVIVNGRVRPAQKWDERQPSHQMSGNIDGSWSKTLPLVTTGGHNRDGVYQFLFSAGANGDWGFCADNRNPGQLLGGCGYNSRTGAIDESAIVIRVPDNGNYTVTMNPATMKFSVSPEVEILNSLPNFQINGSVHKSSWLLSASEHQMIRRGDGRWEKTLALTPSGGEAGNGWYAINFSIGALWALDGIGSGGRWGHTWHAVPQEHNILFRVNQAGNYTVTLDPDAGRFDITPPVEPLETILSLKIAGSFEELANDGANGWNLTDPRHAMRSIDGRVFTQDFNLLAGRTYEYKYAANDAGWSWGMADYPYDGERRLASHGNPPPLKFTAQHDGLHRFTADVVSGHYGVVFIGNTR